MAVKLVELSSEWLEQRAAPRKGRREEYADKLCKGLVLRIGPSGVRTFYRYEQEHDPATGKARRKRVMLGRWSKDGGGGSLSLGDARKLFVTAREARRAEVSGVASLTVADLAKVYRENVLSQREQASNDWSWGIIERHVLAARPDPRRPPFGEWPASEVEPPDLNAVVNAAKVVKERRAANRTGKEVARRLGGRAVARAALRELKAIFSTAVGAGMMKASPASELKAPALGLHGRSRSRALDAEEVGALFTSLDLSALLDGTAKRQRLSEAVRLAVALLLYVPVRSHSLIGARWEEFDLEAGLWLIPPARQKLRRAVREQAGAFTAPLCPTAVAILRRLQALAGDSPWVLASPTPAIDGAEPKHLAPKVLLRALVRLQDSGRLALAAKLTVHDLRRTWRSWAENLGVDFEVAEKSLAHTLPGVASVYGRGAMVERRAEAAALVGAAFDRIRLGAAAPVVPLAERAARAR